MIFVSAIAALVGPFVQFVYAPMLTAGGTTRFIGVLIGSIVLSAGFMAGCSLFEALTERYSRKFGFEYGQSRAWGSFGYAIVALCAGFLFNINPLLNFWVGSICGLGMLCIYAFWVPAEQKEELKKEADPNAAPTNPSFKEMISVLKMPTLWVLIVFMLFTNTFYTVFDQQMFPNYYASLFSTTEIGNATYGTPELLPGVPRVRHDGCCSDHHEEDRRAQLPAARCNRDVPAHRPVRRVPRSGQRLHRQVVPLHRGSAVLPAGIPLLHPALRHQAVGYPVHGGLPDRFPDRPR